MKPSPIRVLIVDDNKIVRRGLRLRLQNAANIVVVGEAGSGRDALAVAGAERVDVVLLDLHMPGLSGIETTRALLQDVTSPPRVVLITSDVTDAFVIDAVDAGAVGYLLKNHDTDQLVEVIRGAMSGTATISSRVTPRLLREMSRRRPAVVNMADLHQISRAEARIVEQLCSGVTSNDDIARVLNLSVHTVRTQAATAMRKVGVADRTQLALWGMKNGLGDRPFSTFE